mmetsp:Transcript_6976/g.13568  ORF Transcript_6976/g.13568 Transcript_6976/m.13568 type:complete len:238 (-) Transcript_6976:226-939(-)
MTSFFGAEFPAVGLQSSPSHASASDSATPSTHPSLALACQSPAVAKTSKYPAIFAESDPTSLLVPRTRFSQCPREETGRGESYILQVSKSPLCVTTLPTAHRTALPYLNEPSAVRSTAYTSLEDGGDHTCGWASAVLLVELVAKRRWPWATAGAVRNFAAPPRGRAAREKVDTRREEPRERLGTTRRTRRVWEDGVREAQLVQARPTDWPPLISVSVDWERRRGRGAVRGRVGSGKV